MIASLFCSGIIKYKSKYKRVLWTVAYLNKSVSSIRPDLPLSKALAAMVVFLFSVGVMAKPLSMLDAVQTALVYNDELQAKQASMLADKEGVTQAWASIKPNVIFRYNTGYAEYKTNYGLGEEEDRYTRGTFSVIQPLYSHQRFKNIGLADQSFESSEIQFALDQQTKTLEVLQAYLELTKYLKLQKNYELEVEDHIVRVDRLNAMLERGLATKMDTLEANARYDELKANLIKNQNEVRVRKKQLERILGVPAEEVLPADETLWKRAQTIVSHQNWYDQALSHSLSIKLAASQYEEAQLDVSVKRAAHYPELTLRAEASDIDSYETTLVENRKVLVELTVPIYQGGATQSKVDAAQYIRLNRQHLLSERKRELRVRLDEALSRLEGSVANIEALQKSVRSGSAYLEAAQKGLSYGLRGVFDVLEAKSRQYNAERKLVHEIYDNLATQFEFLYLMGRLDATSVDYYLNQPFLVENWM